MLSQKGKNNGFFALEVVPTTVNYSSTPDPLFIASHLKMSWDINGVTDFITLGKDLDRNFIYKVEFSPGSGAINSTLSIGGFPILSVDIPNSILGFEGSGPLMAGSSVIDGEGFVGCIESGRNILLSNTGGPGTFVDVKDNCTLDYQLGCPQKGQCHAIKVAPYSLELLSFNGIIEPLCIA